VFRLQDQGGKEGICSVKDDLQPILQKAVEADVLVCGQEVYRQMNSSSNDASRRSALRIAIFAHILPIRRQHDILHTMRCLEQRGDFVVGESGDAAADASDEERQLGVLPGEPDELIDIRTDGFHAALHRGYGITLTLQANALPHDGPELTVGNVSRTAAVHSLQVTAEYEDLVRFQRCDELWCCTFLLHISLY